MYTVLLFRPTAFEIVETGMWTTFRMRRIMVTSRSKSGIRHSTLLAIMRMCQKGGAPTPILEANYSLYGHHTGARFVACAHL